MITLRQRLIEILPSVLPVEPERAIYGNELLKLVKPLLGKDYKDSSIRQHFSVMAGDTSTPIAKVDAGHGYYLRAPFVSRPPFDTKVETSLGGEVLPEAITDDSDEPEGSRSMQREEKFRAIYIQHSALNNRFPVHIEHTKGIRREAGVNKWKFPDVVLLEWQVGEVSDAGYRLVPDLLEVKRSLGEQPFKLSSIELKVGLTPGSFRQNFFQCVSNSKWAHNAQLAVANSVADTVLAEELRRLGTSYDVSILTYGLHDDFLDRMPSSEEILRYSPDRFEDEISTHIKISHLSSGRDRQNLDWEHIRDLRSQSVEFNQVFRWISHCLEKKKPYTFDEFRTTDKVESKYK